MTYSFSNSYVRLIFQSTCHIRGMTFLLLGRCRASLISIHMPHTWHDLCVRVYDRDELNFNPHATYVA